ncbi:MAG: hypothetical protein GAK29_02515 [Acinetobacter bereziniae]|uniref:Uncharacterized protein n=1 Tax=Acinetobacter bereziniae TaxID=106648 RepID=A0A833PEU2_ACIBZ|nr:MAG: hypothetical protein GAK29_02515 [Acinetobacter bereziniae]
MLWYLFYFKDKEFSINKFILLQLKMSLICAFNFFIGFICVKLI